MPIIAQLMTMKAQTRCLQLETYLWLYFGILGHEDILLHIEKQDKKINDLETRINKLEHLNI